MSRSIPQIRMLYLYSGFNCFKLAGASWVALLAARGYSLVEIGLAESVFHLTSLLFELPSGIVADVFGRKRTLLLSQLFTLLSAVLMLFASSFLAVLVAMVLTALGYNFASGTREALAYDSLKAAGQEEAYADYAARDSLLYRIVNSTATLCAGLALLLGPRRAYLADVLLSLFCFALLLRLKEAPVARERENVRQRLRYCLQGSLSFLRKERRALKLILLNASVGALATLLAFFLQARLPEKGLPSALLGPALFFMSMGGAAGSALSLRMKDVRYGRLWLCVALGVTLCLGLSLFPRPALMCACGFLAALLDDLLEIRTNVRLNALLPSEQRASLISVSSLCFSLVMAGLSPLIGELFSVM